MFSVIKENLFLWFILFLLIVSPSFLFGAVGIILLIILALVVFGVVSLLLFRRKLRKMAQQGGAQGSYTSSGAQRSGDPEVKIFHPKSEKRVSADVGDYVDFEEVEE